MLPKIRDQIIINHESGEMSIDLQANDNYFIDNLKSNPSTSPKSNQSNPKREKGIWTIGCLYSKDCRLFNT